MCQSYIPGVGYIYQNILAGIRCQEDLLQMTFHLSCGQVQHQLSIAVLIRSSVVSRRYALHLGNPCCNGLLDIVLYIVCDQLIIGNKISSQSIAVFFINRKFVSLTNLLGKLIAASVAVICRIYQCSIPYIHGHRSIVIRKVTDKAASSPGINMSLQGSDCHISLYMVRIRIFIGIHPKRIRIA